MHSSTRLGLEIADGTDLESGFPAVDAQAKGILDNAVLITEGTLAARPAANSVEKDHVYKATDTGLWYVSDGTNWNTLLIAGAWQNLTLTTNWGAYASGYTPSARLEGDTVRLKGAIQNNTGSVGGGTIATVPAAMIPGKPIPVTAINFISGAAIADTFVDAVTGNLVLPSGTVGNTVAVILDGITYTLS